MPGPRRARSTEKRDRPDRSISRILAGRALVGGQLRSVEIGIDDTGRILEVARSLSGAPRRDVGDRVILPAATDLHVHLREPGGAGETIRSGTIEAALGGVTLVGDMPNNEPPVTSPDRLAEKADLARGQAAVDILLYAAPLAPEAVPGLARSAGALKLYVSPTTGIDRALGPAELQALLVAASRYDLPVTVHAEAPARFKEDRPARTTAEWSAARPPAAEAEALGWLGRAPPAMRLHVAHLTLAEEIPALRRAGRSFEVTPHHLLLSDAAGADTRAKVNPPLRARARRDALWAAFARGEVPMLASDHAPHPQESKAEAFDRAPSGMPGLETMLPLLLARVRSGTLSLEVLVRAACDRPARWFGQPLGRIAPGHRANLLVVDFRARRTVEASRLHAPCGWSAFEGREAIWPVEHWRDGVAVVEDGEYVGRADGAVVVPEFSPAARARRAG